MGQPKPSHDQPSMDEILSSIRRIIERNDAVVPAEGEAAGSDADLEEAQAAQAADEFDSDDDDAGGDERRPMNRSELDSFAEALDARVSASAETVYDVNGILTPPATDEGVEGKYEARFSEDDSRAFAEVASVLAATAGDLPASSPDTASSEDKLAEDLDTSGLTADLDDDEFLRRHEQEMAGVPEPLVSSDVSRTVGVSLDALSKSLRTNAGRDLQMTAEDMLRPMLADWLDNNLPQIVERLVRAEIERIARGEPRRG